MKYKLEVLLVILICANVLLFLLWNSKVVWTLERCITTTTKKIIKQYAESISKSHDLSGNSYSRNNHGNGSFSTTLVNNPNNLTVELVASRLAILWTNGYIFNSCTKSKRIYYAKPPKTGSTTLRWVLYSFALRNKLKICTDAVHWFHMNFPYKIDPETVMGTEHGCDIIADELIFDMKVLEKFAGMKSSDHVKFLTSVREPIRHFLSVYNHANVPNFAGLSTTQRYRLFFLQPKLNRLYTLLSRTGGDHRAINTFLRPNLQLHSLGIPEYTWSNHQVLLTAIFEKLKQMQFAVMSDHFDESMVILKRIFCWSDEEVMYMELNQKRHTTHNALPEDVIKSIANYTKGDRLLFEVANMTLWKIIEKVPHFETELSSHRRKLREYKSLCKSEKHKSYECMGTGNLGKIRFDIHNASKRYLNEKLKELIKKLR